MAYHVQYRAETGKWRVSGFARAHATAGDAWKYAASLDQDGLIDPNVRVVDSAGKVVERPARDTYQAELLGL